MKKKSIFTVSFFSRPAGMGLTSSCQAVKADTEDEARTKFAKRFPKVSEQAITDVSELEPDHKFFRLLSSHAI